MNVTHRRYNVLSWGFDKKIIDFPKLQKRAIRIIYRSKYNADTDPIMTPVNLLKLEYIFTRHCLMLFHTFVHYHVPNFVNGSFLRNAA